MKTFLLTLTGVCSLSVSQISYATDTLPFNIAEDSAGYNRPPLPAIPPPKYALGGFISQSWVKTSDGVHLSGSSDSKYGSLRRTEVGLFGTLSFNPYVDVRWMISSFNDGRFEDGNPQINYSLIDLHDQDSDYGVRVGRISNTAGFYSEQRNVPAFRDMELASQGIYKEAYHRLSSGGIGAQAYLKILEVGNWLGTVECSRFKADVSAQNELNYAFFGADVGEFQPNTRFKAYGAKLRNDKLGLVLRYDLNNVLTKVVYDEDSVLGKLVASDHQMVVRRYGIRKYFQFGDFTVERADYSFKSCPDVSCPTPYGHPVATAFVYKHYLTPKINLVLSYDTYYLKTDEVEERPRTLTGKFEFTPSEESRYAKSLNLGAQMKDGPFTYKAEIHLVKGQSTILASEKDLNSKTLPKGYNVFILNVSYGF